VRKWSKSSASILANAHPDLQRAFTKALQDTPLDLKVLESTRTVARQKYLVRTGKSKTMNSRHIPSADGKSRAIDIVPLRNGQISWDWKDFHAIAPAIKKAFSDLNIPIEWGGDWKSFPDGPHWQLPWSVYP